jgi:AAHS family 4-hydroxybenzoate transporter-like MFS transporter
MSAFGAIFSAGTFGTLVGAMSLGRLADWIGRQRALIVCTLLFAVLTMATTLVHTATELSILRFAAGLGLGGAMPGFLTIVSEYAPRARKALFGGLLWCGYPVGGMIGGLVGAHAVAAYGWQTMFYLGGGLAFLIALLQALFLPESMQFLALKGGQDDRIRRIAARVAPELDLAQARFVADTPTGARAGIGEVFAEGRTASTVLLWIPLFFTFMISTFFVLWTPTLFKTAGMSISTAALMVALNNFAAIPSQATTGYLVDKAGPFRLLPITYGVLMVAIAVMAFSLKATPVVAAAMLVTGFLYGPGISGLLYIATALYPSKVRSTGVGLAMGVGRSGQVVGALVIGGALAKGYGAKLIILGMCAPPLIALVCIALLGLSLRGGGPLGKHVGGSPAERPAEA